VTNASRSFTPKDVKEGIAMVAACFRFVLPEGTDWKALRQMMKERAKAFHKLPGLRSKAFLLDEGRREIGGNYVWETREALDAYLRSDLYLAVVRKVGEPQELRIYEVAEYVDKAEVTAALRHAA
jgi:heme-degrading monooxygenase HmoA